MIIDKFRFSPRKDASLSSASITRRSPSSQTAPVPISLTSPPIMKDGELDESMFGGNAMTYYGRWSYKFEEGLRQGAAGVIVVNETIPAGYTF